MSKDPNETSVNFERNIVADAISTAPLHPRCRVKGRFRRSNGARKKRGFRPRPVYKKKKPEERDPRPMLDTQYRFRKIEADFKSTYKVSKQRMHDWRKLKRKKRREKKWKRIKHRARKKMSKQPNCGVVIVKLSMGTRKRKKAKNKVLKARRRRAEKIRNQRIRKIRGLHGHFGKKAALKKKVENMSAAQLSKLLSRKKFKRFRKLRRVTRKVTKLMSRPKQRALKMITFAIRVAKHQRRKRLKFKRWMIKKADQRKKPIKKKTHKVSAPETITWKKIHPEVDVTDEYSNDYPERVLIFMPDELYLSNKVHLLADTPYMLDCGVSVKLVEDVKGISGRVSARVMHAANSYKLHFRYRLRNDYITKYDERTILALLLKGGSKNCLRVMYSGYQEDLRFTLTSMFDKTLADLITEYKEFKVPVAVHLVEQTFLCMRELHRLGYCYTILRPSAFAVCSDHPTTIVLTDFPKLRTFKDIHDEHINKRQIDERQISDQPCVPLDRVHVEPYMSRRQHMRSFRGPGDDYESWFYICARVVNGEPLKWETQTDSSEMLLSKYDFPREYGHPDPEVHEFMMTLQQYALSATLTNCMTIAHFIEEVLREWKRILKFPVKQFPWINEDEARLAVERKNRKQRAAAEKLQAEAAELEKEWAEWHDKYKDLKVKAKKK